MKVSLKWECGLQLKPSVILEEVKGGSYFGVFFCKISEIWNLNFDLAKAKLEKNFKYLSPNTPKILEN